MTLHRRNRSAFLSLDVQQHMDFLLHLISLHLELLGKHFKLLVCEFLVSHLLREGGIAVSQFHQLKFILLESSPCLLSFDLQKSILFVHFPADQLP
jgi:hypothetical protein